MSTLEFHVLGPLEIRSHGEALVLGGSKQRSLLAILLLNANEVVSVDRMIDELWGAEAPETATKALQVHVSQLRKVLEPERRSSEPGRLLVTRSPGYMLRLERDQLDLDRFRGLAAEGREALAGGDPARAAERLREALALWRGAPLADLAYEEFARAEIDRLEELRQAALEDRIQADLDCGRHSQVIGELERLVAEQPLREGPLAQLMLALYRAGRQAEALSVYRRARRRLVDELGIEPGGELKRMEAAILKQDPGLQAPAPVQGRASATTTSSSFVGRESELAQFDAALEGARSGRTSVLLLAGEPGIGKSRLADEMTAVAQARGARVLWGRCWEEGGAPPYWPWVQALRTYLRDPDHERIRAELEAGAADLAQILPEVGSMFPDLAPAPSLDPEGARFRLFDSTASLMRVAAESQPLVLVIDDLHAGDTPSLLLFQFLARSLRDAQVVLVGAYRDAEADAAEELAAIAAELRREPTTRSVRLGGLSVSEVARFVELVTGRFPSEALATAIRAETEGNPLFVGELVRLLAAEGRLEDVAGSSWRSRIPGGVREVIAHRLRHLSDACKRLLSVASVLGREFRLDALERVSECEGDELFDLLDEAREARVIVDPQSRRRGAMRFSHALIRDSLYDDLSTTERLQLHRRAAEGLEALYEQDPEPHLAELAHHFLEAARGGDASKAVDYSSRAADRASVSLAYEEAARLYGMALVALEMAPQADESRRCALLLALGDAQSRGGDAPSAKESFARAADLARRLGEAEQLARAALGYGGRFIWFRAGPERRLVPLLEDALAALPEPGPLRARLLARLPGALRDDPSPARRTALSREAVALARQLGDAEALTYALEGMYAASCWPRETDAWLAMGRELVQLGAQTGEREREFFGRVHGFGAFMVRGNVDEARVELEAMAELGRELRQPAQHWALSISRGTLALFTGRLDEAERQMRQVGEVGSGAQGLDATFYYALNLQAWALRREQGRLAEAEASLEEFVESYPNFVHYPNLIVASIMTNLHSELGRREQARAELGRILGRALPELELGTEWFFGVALLAETCWTVGATEHSADVYEALLPYADHNVFAHPEIARGSASRQLGLLAATMSRWNEAWRHFDDALEMNERMGARTWLAHTEHEYAQALIANGVTRHRERARELLAAARDRYRELGMTSWAERAEADQTRV